MKEKLKNILGIFYGIVYGASLIIPGLSGGTFLVIFGCYDKICAAMSLEFKAIKKHFVFYLLFGIGAIAGLIGFVFAIGFLLNRFNTQTYLFFLGLIMGGVPIVVKTATAEEKFKPLNLIPFVLGLALIIGLTFAPTPEAAADGETGQIFLPWIAFCGMVAAVAMVLPGISGAFVLLAFGVYDTFTGALRELDFAIIIPAIIGVLAGIVGGARLIRFLLKRYKLMVYSAIIGMVLGSIVPVLNQASPAFDVNTLIGFAFMLAGIFTVAALGKIAKPNDN